ncbi:MAG: DUF1566 domain-containing protein [Anaerolineae bacterium]|nr:DUF1566 domain-containing protein [Anaerolineae bacterium]
MNRKSIATILIVSILANLLLVWQVWAGSPDSPGAPNATSSFTLADLYNRLNSGAAGTQSTFTEPSTAPGAGTMYTLNDIMTKAPAADDASGATAAQVAAGKTFWGLTGGQWGLRTGTMTNNGAVTITPGTSDQSIAAGYHSGSGLVYGDSDLLAENILWGVNIFGVDGALYPARVPVTGQTSIYNSGDDGNLLKGVAWPDPRFTDNGDGTVTDNLTGLIWTKNANCTDMPSPPPHNWEYALTMAAAMESGDCGVSDGSAMGDWRLPNVRELMSLIDYENINPALPTGHPFTNVQNNIYWTSTTHKETGTAFHVYLTSGSLTGGPKDFNQYVWLVRDPQ